MLHKLSHPGDPALLSPEEQQYRLDHAQNLLEEKRNRLQKPQDTCMLKNREGPYVFDQPIAIEPGNTSCVEQSATMLYNLALSHHLQGLNSNGGIQEEIANKAITLYESALSLVSDLVNDAERQQARGHQHNYNIDIRLIVACLNNIGQIHFEMGQYNLSEALFGRLSGVLMTVRQSDVVSSISFGDWGGLILNTMTMVNPRLAPAA
jgi:tetratricopeptide (TPR) repeat protein